MPMQKPLPVQMLDLINGYWVSKMLHVVAELDVASILAEGPCTVAELAASMDVQAERLVRVLRALASVGVFQEDESGRFSNTPLSETLCAEREDSMRAFARMMPSSCNWHAWDGLMAGVRQSVVPFEVQKGSTHFQYLEQHPDEEAVFAAAMASVSGAENPAVANALDSTGIRTLVDVGGSGGHLLSAVLHQHAQVNGVLFDQLQVVEAARLAPFLTAPALAGRVAFEGGDFFKAVPEGADAYLMKYILHDWNDDQCVQILTRCREVMAESGQVIVVDNVIEAGNEPSWGKLLDVNMLVLTGGRERTAEAFAALFARAGLKLDRIVPTECPLSLIIAKAAS
tara:strand:+ start:5161 stop:6183 length:1023 start_codon:yes stop_codon:yes gene_type:complete